MSILDSILNKAGFVRKEKEVPGFSNLGNSDPLALFRPGGAGVSDQQAMRSYTGWTFACARAIGEEIAKLKFKLYKVQKDGDYEEVYDHELLDQLNSPNPYQTSWELKFMLGVHMELAGKGYWLLDGVEKANDKPRGIYPLIPSGVKIKLGEFPNLIQEYEYRVNNKTYKYKPEQIINFRYPDPNNMLAGFGVVQGIAQWIDADNYQTEFNRRFFLNGAKVGGYLESDTARSPEMLDYMKKSFEALFKGVDNAYRVAALPKGTTFKEGSASQKDMDFVEGKKDSRDSILAGFRVPRTALGITDDVNRANAEATDYVFAERTIKPKYDLICEFLNTFLVPRYGDDLVLSYDDPVPENRELRIREMQAAVASQAVISTNEAREEYFGLKPVENGDDVLTDFSKVPLGATPPEPAADESGKKFKPKMKIGKPYKRKEPLKDATEKAADEIAGAVIGVVKEINEQQKAQIKSIVDLSHEEYGEKVWSKFVGRLQPYQKLLTKKIRTYNANQKKEVLANLAEATKSYPDTKAVDPKKLLDADKWSKAMTVLADPVLTDLFEKEGMAAGKLIGYGGFTITPEVRNALDHSLELLAASYTETTLAKLKDVLEQAISEGAGLKELEDKVEQIYAFSDSYRAAQVAHTETFRIANDATHESWDQSGVVKTIKWYTASDENVCEFCGPMDGEIIDISDGFFGKGETITGREGGKLDLDYEDVDNPPLHVDCRCFIRPEEISVD